MHFIPTFKLILFKKMMAIELVMDVEIKELHLSEILNVLLTISNVRLYRVVLMMKMGSKGKDVTRVLIKN